MLEEDEKKIMDWKWQTALTAAMLLLTMFALVVLYTHGCSVGPKKTVVTQGESPPPPPPVTCDGVDLGTTRNQACPAGQAGQNTQVCTAAGWKDAQNSCATTPPPVCNKTTFADILPILNAHAPTACVNCHASITTYAVAQSWSAEISRRVNLPTSNNDHMPQGASPQLSGAEVSLIEKWVSDGTVKDCTQASNPSYITEDYVVSAMVNDATSLSSTDRPFTRYLVTAHAIDAGITGPALQTWIAAINKALNGVNEDTQDVFSVQSIEPTGSVFRFDLRTFGFGSADIKAIEGGDVNINIVDNTSKGLVLQALIGTNKPWFHADNFIDILYRNSSVYYQLLKIPLKLVDLQKKLNINFNSLLAALDAQFIGSSSSPIAEQKNRLLVRVVQGASQSQYYWQSFDVNAIPHNVNVVVNGQNVLEDTKNLFQFPLIAGTGGVELFTQDASEIIFTLPNGFQAYVLTDAAGNRLNFADPNVVIDTATPLGNKIINAGNSCGRCHNQGLIPMPDQILAHVTANAAQFNSNDVQIVQRLYRSAPANAAHFTADNRVFAQSLARVNVDANKPDPMSIVTDRFLQNWDINQAAALFLLTPTQFEAALNTSPVAKAQIGQLLSGGTVTFAQFISVIQQLIKDARLFQDPL